jgi:hypothetical protein
MNTVDHFCRYSKTYNNVKGKVISPQGKKVMKKQKPTVTWNTI